jgi:type I restriction enzyme R subunit
MTQILIEQFKNKNKIPLDAVSTKYINGLIVKEYLNEFTNFNQ